MNAPVRFSTIDEAIAAFEGHRDGLIAAGAEHARQIRSYLPESWKRNYALALDEAAARFGFTFDAQPAIQTDPNSAVPALLTTLIDPEVYRVLFAPNKAAEIFGEVRKGTWLDDTALFPTVEHGGEVTSYGDFATSGGTTVNFDFPNRQAYLFQTVKEYGERELERAGLARINYVTEKDVAAATMLNKFLNFTYFFGVAGLLNFGLLNDPNLPAAITPATKAAGGTKWTAAGNIVVATANEIFADIEALYLQLVTQTSGLVERTDQLVLALPPVSEGALTTTNQFSVNVSDLIKKNFPGMKVISAMQYDVTSSSNPEGQASGRLMQLIAPSVGGQKTGYCAFNEKMRAHPIVRYESSFRQKVSGGSWGTILRMPFAIAAMSGI